jgi:N4-gp56 family major capsid protein
MFLKKFTGALIALFGLGLDSVTVSVGTAGVAGNVQADQGVYLTSQLLEVAEFNTILDQFAESVMVPANNSNTCRFVRMEKLSVTNSPAQLTEGVSPDALPITLNQFTATLEQYGNVIRITDVAQLTAKHPVLAAAIQKLGLQAAEIRDILIYNVLDAATNVYRPNSKAGDTSLTASDQLSYVDTVSLFAVLTRQAARPYSNGQLGLILAPEVYAALLKDPDFKASNQYAAPEKIWRGQVGSLANFAIVQSNSPSFASTAQAGSGQASKVYSGFAVGQYAFQVSDWQTLQMYTAAPGGQTDVLQQNYKAGWKFAFKSVITNQNWLRRVRTPGIDSVTNP